MPSNEVRVVLVHGAWADGSSWAKVIAPLAAQGFNVVAAPLRHRRSGACLRDARLSHGSRPAALDTNNLPNADL